MKKSLLLLAALAATACMQAQNDYELRTLTFEDSDVKEGFTNLSEAENWSGLIDSVQYGGHMLYWNGSGSNEQYYAWYDGGNTNLHNELSQGYGTYCYWSGGHAISNYGSGEAATYGDYLHQLTVYKAGVLGIAREGCGHNGSNNFAMHFGYADNSGYGLGEDALPTLVFADGVARVIDHMYITNSCYAINCYIDGNSLTAKIGPDDWVKVVATGYDANGEKVAQPAEIYLCNGPDNIVKDWTKFDLSALGSVTKVSFNIMGSSNNGYGFSQPAYFAYDDVAVRFPSETPTAVDDVTAKTVARVQYVSLQGQVSDRPFDGVNVKVTTYTDGTQTTSKIAK